jgi:hypothetical protein
MGFSPGSGYASALLIFLALPPLCAGQETFYVCQGGDGTQPDSAECGASGTCWDTQDFGDAANWDGDDRVDGKIGPGDTVVLLDDCGTLTRNSGGEVLAVRRSGLSERPITVRGEVDGSTRIDGQNARECIFTGNKSHLVLSDFECTRGEPFGILIWDSDYVTIQDAKIHDARRANIQFAGANGLVTRCELYNSHEEHGLYFSEEFTRDCTIEYNYSHDNRSSGFQFNSNSTNQTGMVVRYNWIENNREQDINNLGMNGGEIYGNVIVNTRGDAWHAVWFGDDGPGEAAYGVKVYNNTIFGEYGWALAVGDGSAGHQFYNNIVVLSGSSGVIVEIAPGSNVTLDYNSYYRGTFENAWSVNGNSHSSLAAWRESLGGCPETGNDCGSLDGDPRLADPENGDVSLFPDSVCIDAGTDSIGSRYRMMIDSGSTRVQFGPKGSLALRDQADFGTGWEMGAYVAVSAESSPPPPQELRIVEKN